MCMRFPRSRDTLIVNSPGTGATAGPFVCLGTSGIILWLSYWRIEMDKRSRIIWFTLAVLGAFILGVVTGLSLFEMVYINLAESLHPSAVGVSLAFRPDHLTCQGGASSS